MPAAETAAPPAENNGAGDPQEIDSLVIRGDGQLGFDVGGKRPTTSSFSLRGKKIEVDGSVKKGQVVVLRCEVRIGGVHFDDQIDSATQEVVGCTRKQVGRIVGVSRIE